MSDQPLTPRSPEMVWQMYERLTAQCEHFNGLESTYRALASTWLLAAFGAVGYVLNAQAVERPALLVAAIGSAGALGIVLIWMLDLQVYHTLLVAAFAEQIRLEREHPWLPQVGHLMQAAHAGAGVVPKVVWFYVAAYSLMVGTAAAAIGMALPAPAPLARTLFAILVFAIAATPVVWRMRRSASSATADVTAYAESKRAVVGTAK